MRILLIEDEPYAQQGLFDMLSEILPDSKVFVAESCEEALEFQRRGEIALKFHNPDKLAPNARPPNEINLEFDESSEIDLILQDFHLDKLPDTDALTDVAALKVIIDAFDPVPVVMLTAVDDPKIIRACLQNGAVEYLTKAEVSREKDIPKFLRAVIDEVEFQPVWRSLDIYDQQTSDKIAGDVISEGPLDHLTGRDLEVLAKVVQGGSDKAVARELNISVSAVKHHMEKARAALGVTTRGEAAAAVAKLRPSLLEADGEK